MHVAMIPFSPRLCCRKRQETSLMLTWEPGGNSHGVEEAPRNWVPLEFSFLRRVHTGPSVPLPVQGSLIGHLFPWRFH